MKPVDLDKLLGPYYDSGLYLAVTRDWQRVVGKGKTMDEATQDAIKNGYTDHIICKSGRPKARLFSFGTSRPIKEVDKE